MHDLAEGEERRQKSAALFNEARKISVDAGLILKQHSLVHYSLTSIQDGWISNIYPGNRRLYYDRNKSKPPHVNLPLDWNLLDVVNAFVKIVKKKHQINWTAAVKITETVEQRAYFLWEQAGRPENSSAKFWLQAEKELNEQNR